MCDLPSTALQRDEVTTQHETLPGAPLTAIGFSSEANYLERSFEHDSAHEQIARYQLSNC